MDDEEYGISDNLVFINGVCQSEYPIACGPLTQDYELSDDEYRRFIKAKILFNTTDYSFNNVQCILDYIFEGRACLLDIFSNNISVLFTSPVSEKERALLFLYMRILPTQLFTTYQFFELPSEDTVIFGVVCDDDEMEECGFGGWTCDPNDPNAAIVLKPITAPCDVGQPNQDVFLPMKIQDIPNQNVVLGQPVNQFAAWRNVRNFGSETLYTLKGAPLGMYTDTVGVIKGQISPNAVVGQYEAVLEATNAAGTIECPFMVEVTSGNNFCTFNIRPSAVVQKMVNTNSRVSVGLQTSSTGAKSGTDVFGDPGTEDMIVNGVKVQGFDVSATSLSNTTLPNTIGDGDYEICLTLEGDHTDNGLPFNNLYTGNRRYSADSAQSIQFDPERGSTIAIFESSRLELPCWYLDLSVGFEVFFPGICDIVNNGVAQIGNTSILEKRDVLPGLSTINFGFDF